jgi:hypothetical protein
LLVPGGALANNTNQLEDDYNNDDEFTQQDLAGGDVDTSKDGDWETNHTALKDAEDTISDAMKDMSESEFDVIQIPFTSLGIHDGFLEVGIHPFAKQAGIQYTDWDIQQAVGLDVPVKISYIEMMLEDSTTGPQTFEEEYFWYCVPPQPGFYEICKNMDRNHNDVFVLSPEDYDKLYFYYNVPQPEAEATPESHSSLNPNSCRSETQSTACYYVMKWKNSCTPSSTSDRACMSIWNVLGIFHVDKSKLTAPTSTSTQNYTIENFRASQVGDAVKLTWSDPDYKAYYYKVYYKTQRASTFTEIGRTYSEQYTVPGSSLQAGQTYQFAVKAYIAKTNPSTGNYFSNLATSQYLTVKSTAPAPLPDPVISKSVTDLKFYQKNTLNWPIPDNTDSLDVKNSITVPSGWPIKSAKVSFVIDHDDVDELVVRLTAPDGTPYNLHNRANGPDYLSKSYSTSNILRSLVG